MTSPALQQLIDKKNYNWDQRLSGWLKGFAARIECVQRLAPPQITESGLDVVAITNQYAKVLRCMSSTLNTNGKTIHNLRTSAEKLNEMLLSAEVELRKNYEA